MRRIAVFVVLIFAFLLFGVVVSQSKEEHGGYKGSGKEAIKSKGDESRGKLAKESEKFQKKHQEMKEEQEEQAQEKQEKIKEEKEKLEEELGEKKEEVEKAKEEGEAIGKSEKGRRGRSEAAQEMAIEKGEKRGKTDKGKAWWKFWQTGETEEKGGTQ